MFRVFCFIPDLERKINKRRTGYRNLGSRWRSRSSHFRICFLLFLSGQKRFRVTPWHRICLCARLKRGPFLKKFSVPLRIRKLARRKRTGRKRKFLSLFGKKKSFIVYQDF